MVKFALRMQMMMKMLKNGNVMVILHGVGKKLYCMNPIVYQAMLTMDPFLDYLIPYIIYRDIEHESIGSETHELCKTTIATTKENKTTTYHLPPTQCPPQSDFSFDVAPTLPTF